MHSTKFRNDGARLGGDVILHYEAPTTRCSFSPLGSSQWIDDCTLGRLTVVNRRSTETNSVEAFPWLGSPVVQNRSPRWHKANGGVSADARSQGNSLPVGRNGRGQAANTGTGTSETWHLGGTQSTVRRASLGAHFSDSTIMPRTVQRANLSSCHTSLGHTAQTRSGRSRRSRTPTVHRDPAPSWAGTWPVPYQGRPQHGG